MGVYGFSFSLVKVQIAAILSSMKSMLPIRCSTLAMLYFSEVAWPWQDSEAALSKFMTDSFAQVLFEFCQGYGAASQL